jgi:hypothetical protein
MSWVAAADYRRGAKEERPGQPCRAYGQIIRLDADTLVGAVADGADDALLSHQGAKIAVRAALAGITNMRESLSQSCSESWRQSAEANFRSILAKVDIALNDAAAAREVSVRDLQTSLVVFAVSHQGTIAARVGPGMVVARGRDHAYIPLFSSRNGDRSTRIPLGASALAETELEIAHASGPLSFVCAATDGFQSLTSRRMGQAKRRRFLSRLDHCASVAPTDSDVHQEIRSLLRSARIAPRIKEDLGVALCGYRPQGELFNAAFR